MEWFPWAGRPLDIILVSFLLYYTYDALRKSGSGSLFIGILALVTIWQVTKILNMRVLGSILMYD